MPARPPTICTHPGCRQLADKTGRCKAHPRKSGWQRTEEKKGNRHARGYGASWSRLRRRVLERDAMLCQPCKAAGRISQANQVDHITPKAAGGTDEPDNLQAICDACHKAKTLAERQKG